MVDFFKTSRSSFNLFGAGRWRQPQLGALGAVLAHWSLGRHEPTVISIPTGTGKTAVGLAAPFLATVTPTRVLVLAPAQQIRRQLAEQFASYAQLVRLGVLPETLSPPSVYEMTGHANDWSALEQHDVVVALPNSISPVHYGEGAKPPADLFDLLVVDEAHHAPARTWSALLDHFAAAPALLLTATPQRVDGKRIPGSLEYYYPLRRALDEGLYQPIEPLLLQAPDNKRESDKAIALAAAEMLAADEHATSVMLVRGGSIQRLHELEGVYREAGVELALLHNRLSKANQTEIVDALRAAQIRAVGVVGMLGEGFDLPTIRLVSYHDKHRSIPATVQLIGRLARVDSRYPQRSTLITVADADVYPELKGVLRELYDEDADWAAVLPGILDEEIAQGKEDRLFIESLPESTTEVDPSHIAPLKRALVYEVRADWEPGFLTTVPEKLQPGARLLGGRVLYAGALEEARMFVIVVRYVDQPKWSRDPALADVRYELHVAIHRKPPRIDLPGFVLLNLDRAGIQRTLESLLGLEDTSTLAGPERLGPYLDSLDRLSVSSVGIRNTNAATRGRASYRNYMGSGVDRGLRSVDVARSALGHVMFQVNTDSGAANAGAAIEKSKLWLTRYGPLRELSEWADATARLLWFPQVARQGPLLPGVERGHRLDAWPSARPLAAELSPLLLGVGLELWDGETQVGPIEDLDLYVNDDPTGTLADVERPDGDQLRVIGVFNEREANTHRCVWRATIDTHGRITADPDLEVRRGYATRELLSAVLDQQPPTIYFLDGTTTIGALRYDSRTPTAAFDLGRLKTTGWDNVDITAETRRTAEKRGEGKRSIHERLEEYLRDGPRLGTNRWILCNDGSGEIADYVVIEELATGEVALALWHAKGARGNAASVRIGDFQEVVAQAIRSRGALPSTALWDQLARRLNGEEAPRATVVDGSDDLNVLRERLGLDVSGDDEGTETPPWGQRLPVVRGSIGIAQPGLSTGRLRQELQTAPVPPSAGGVMQLFSVLSDTAVSDGAELYVLVSE
jgi:superfamily II DNA or RNA helicase